MSTLSFAEKSLIAMILLMLVFTIGVVAGAWYMGDLKDTIAMKAQQASMDGAAQAIAKIELKQINITKPMMKEIHTNTVYAECKHSPEAFKLLLDSYQ